MVQFTILFLCILGLLSETLCSLTLEAEPGDKVTIWCQHELKHADKIFWFKHTSDSVPLLLGCKQFYTSSPSETCYFFTEIERIVMSIKEKNTSLTITAVNVSDTGLYYCSYMELNQMIFSNSTSLHVKETLSEISEKEGNKTLSEHSGKAKAPDSPVFFMLTVGFGAVSVILLIVLIFIILKHRKTHRGFNPVPPKP
ncbi:Ig kappa chain V19-17-like, partial [Clarias magur]